MPSDAASDDDQALHPALDGRHRRSAASRQKIVGALMDLVRGGDITPSAEAVAERAGVGLRSVFRHFQDMEGLRREMSDLVEAQLADVVAMPLSGATWRARMDDLVARRIDAFERVMPYRRAGLAHAHQSPVLRDNIARWNKIQRTTIRQILPDDLGDLAQTLECLDLTLSFETWIRLRIDQRLSAARAETNLRHMIRCLVGPTLPA